MLGLTILHSTDETVTVRVENQQQRQQQQEETEVLTGNLAHHHDGAAAVNDAAAPSAGVSATHTKRPCPCGGGDDDDDNRAILADTSRSANPPIPGEPSSASATIPLAGKKIRVAEEGRGNRSYPPPSWEEMLLRLAAYKEKNGDTLVPKRFVDDPRLGTWVETQRAQYKRLEKRLDEITGEARLIPNERLTAERLEKLEAIGFAWSGQRRTRGDRHAQDASSTASVAHLPTSAAPTPTPTPEKKPPATKPTEWEPMFQRLSAFRDCHGHCLVPKGYPEDPLLASWVERIRSLGRQEAASGGGVRTVGSHLKSTESNETDTSRAVSFDEAGMVEETLVKMKNDALLLTIERKERLNALGFIWDLRTKRINDHWDDMYTQLCEFKQVHGDCLVPSRYENSKLAKWVETQRYEYSKLRRSSEDLPLGSSRAAETCQMSDSRLNDDRINRLNEVGFQWKVTNKMKRFYDKQWDQMYDRLREYKQVYGHCLVPKRYALDQKLGTWVHTQRMQYRKSSATGNSIQVDSSSDGNLDVSNESEGSKEESIADRLTADRRQRLDELGFCWSARNVYGADSKKLMSRTSYDDQWDTMFQRLEEFKLKFGHSSVPKRYKEDPRLGTWCDTQRVQFKRMKKMLAEAGIVYEGPSSAVQGVHGESSLASPVLGRLTDERIRRLDELGFVWSVRDDWQRHYEELKQFKEEHGHCNVPARYDKNRKLGIFVSAQRSQYKALKELSETHQVENSLARFRTPLTTERIRLLNDLGFTWTVRSKHANDENWTQKLDELKRYYEAHGHCNVPARCTENPALGIWVGTQRTQYRLFMNAKMQGQNAGDVSAMTDDRIRKLENLGFVWVLRGDGKLSDSFYDGLGYDTYEDG